MTLTPWSRRCEVVTQETCKVITRGDFTSAVGVAQSGVACLNASGSLDMVFSPNADNVAVQCEPSWQIFGDNVHLVGEWASMESRDVFRRRVYVAPVGLWLTLDAGTFQPVEYHPGSGMVYVHLDVAEATTLTARLRVEQSAGAFETSGYQPTNDLKLEDGTYEVALGDHLTTAELRSEPIRNIPEK